MSWDVVIMNFGKKRPSSPEEIWETPTRPLGTAAQVRKRISQALPEVKWEGPNWGVYTDGKDLSLEFSVEGKSKIEEVIVHARGGGDAIGALLKIANANGWSLLDTSTSELIDPEHPSAEGWEGFQALVRRAAPKKTRTRKLAQKKKPAQSIRKTPKRRGGR